MPLESSQSALFSPICVPQLHFLWASLISESLYIILRYISRSWDFSQCLRQIENHHPFDNQMVWLPTVFIFWDFRIWKLQILKSKISNLKLQAFPKMNTVGSHKMVPSYNKLPKVLVGPDSVTCSCQKPMACPVSWMIVPRMSHPVPTLMYCGPPIFPTLDQHLI